MKLVKILQGTSEYLQLLPPFTCRSILLHARLSCIALDPSLFGPQPSPCLDHFAGAGPSVPKADPQIQRSQHRISIDKPPFLYPERLPKRHQAALYGQGRRNHFRNTNGSPSLPVVAAKPALDSRIVSTTALRAGSPRSFAHIAGPVRAAAKPKTLIYIEFYRW